MDVNRAWIDHQTGGERDYIHSESSGKKGKKKKGKKGGNN
jgi:hypothetical protein